MLRGDRLRILRMERKYTFEHLANLINVSMRQVMRYETGDSEPTASIIARMAEIFNVTTDYLLGRSDDPKPYLTVDNLSVTERTVLAALRRNDPLAAIKAIVDDPDLAAPP